MLQKKFEFCNSENTKLQNWTKSFAHSNISAHCECIRGVEPTTVRCKAVKQLWYWLFCLSTSLLHYESEISEVRKRPKCCRKNLNFAKAKKWNNKTEQNYFLKSIFLPTVLIWGIEPDTLSCGAVRVPLRYRLPPQVKNFDFCESIFESCQQSSAFSPGGKSQKLPRVITWLVSPGPNDTKLFTAVIYGFS